MRLPTRTNDLTAVPTLCARGYGWDDISTMLAEKGWSYRSRRSGPISIASAATGRNRRPNADCSAESQFARRRRLRLNIGRSHWHGQPCATRPTRRYGRVGP
jgi:hypothetical protein